jgi:thioredoxin 1
MAASGRLTQKKFEQSILHGVSMVFFDALWCAPCRAQKPIIDALERTYQDQATVKKIDIDDNQDIALYLGIQSIPTIILFKEGQEMNRYIGLQNNETLAKALQQLVGYPDTGTAFSRH